jgi:hypothetical protein
MVSLPSLRLALAAALGAVAFGLTLAATRPNGPGLDPDSVSYVNAARSLVRFGSLRVPQDDWESPDSTTPLVHFPPGFSAAIAIPHALGVPPITSARLVEAAAALMTVALTTWLATSAAGIAAGLAAAITVMVTPAIASVHESVLSEPLFLALLLGVLAVMVLAPKRPLLAGLTAALASLVRYAGIAAIGAATLWWLGHPRKWRLNWRHAAMAGLPGVVAQALWVLRCARVSHEESIREISLYGRIGPTLREGAATIGRWLVPRPDVGGASWWGWWAIGGASLAAIALATRAATRAAHPAPARGGWGLGARGARVAEGPRGAEVRTDAGVAAQGGSPFLGKRLLGAAGLLALVYTVVVVAARLIADPGIPLDDRILAPLMLLVELAIVVALARAWPALHGGRAPLRAIAAALVVAWWGTSLAVTVDDARYALEVGSDYADITWRGSPLIAWVRDHAAGRPLFTNFPTALYFHADRFARLLPQGATPAVATAFADTVTARRGLIVAFAYSSDFTECPNALLRRLPVRAIARTRDGSVWVVEPGRPSPPEAALAPCTPVH